MTVAVCRRSARQLSNLEADSRNKWLCSELKVPVKWALKSHNVKCGAPHFWMKREGHRSISFRITARPIRRSFTTCSTCDNPPRANVTALRKWLNTTGSYLVTTQQYDVLGNVVTVTDPGGHATQIDFTDRFTDSINRNSFAYATKVTDASGFYTQSTYDFNA